MTNLPYVMFNIFTGRCIVWVSGRPRLTSPATYRPLRGMQISLIRVRGGHPGAANVAAMDIGSVIAAKHEHVWGCGPQLPGLGWRRGGKSTEKPLGGLLAD